MLSTNISIEAFTSAVIIMSYLFGSRIPMRSIPWMPAGTILKLQIYLYCLCISFTMDARVSSWIVSFMIAKNYFFFFFIREQIDVWNVSLKTRIRTKWHVFSYSFVRRIYARYNVDLLPSCRVHRRSFVQKIEKPHGKNDARSTFLGKRIIAKWNGCKVALYWHRMNLKLLCDDF